MNSTRRLSPWNIVESWNAVHKIGWEVWEEADLREAPDEPWGTALGRMKE